MSVSEIAAADDQALESAAASAAVGRVAGELGRYLVVAVVALAVDFGTLVALREMFGWHHLASAAAGFAFGLMTNYLLSIAWVFSDRVVQNRLVEFALFAMIGVLGLLLTELILYGGSDIYRLDYRISKIIAVVCVFVSNFGARKLVLFRG